MSEIKVDNLTGKTSAGNITVTSEGGAATMQLQQGLAKVWVNFNGTGTIALRDSLNVSSLADNGTGSYDVNFSNNMNDVNYTATSGAGRSLTSVYSGGFLQPSNLATTKFIVGLMNSGGSSEDWPQPMAQIIGDLS